LAPQAEVAEWQTRWIQNPLSERACGFESHLRYQAEIVEESGGAGVDVEGEGAAGGSKIGSTGARSVPVPLFALADEEPAGDDAGRMLGAPLNDAAPASSLTALRADMGRMLADAIARAIAVGDAHAARVALTALSGLVEDAPDQSGAVVADLAEKRRGR
jgi:hypothetical protein